MGDVEQRQPPTRVRVRVPSKINLFLTVRGLRDDGYHELVTILQTVSLYDTVTARLDGPTAQHPAARRSMRLRFTQEATAGVPADEDNLAVRAARVVMAETGLGGGNSGGNGNGPTTRLHLDKHIPVAAGMAGGSADAAAALVALDELWGADLGRARLRELAAQLGADVPFCVSGGTALATGTGTATAQVLTRGTYHWVVGITDAPLSTPDVYRAYDEVATPSQAEPDAVLQALRTGDPEALGHALHNDLEVAAIHLRPDLADKRDALLGAGALGALVSGSGPTVVGLAATAQEAGRLRDAVSDVFDRVEVGSSPAGGPEVWRD
ncbi:4-(cytidine 5'-diphospho)-2-C-methyl-D-erythritol kinase [Nitriliruptor alkaliphilus]|uniref:4-(cytidine 5'-diphospho)-2-C-methyl-D-erythritol kinase n=1 Tax=Nitriliruptor alkaliphilus TaxID=427918 RepID=UPI000A690F59|nr:4-(cytidine 5'-diphospho)-2-C-methyl-D-erythritol kinase [Nitriliruptor alkaliphilus]